MGAGSEMRRTLGTAVFGGMLGVTLFGIFLTPVFFYVIEWINDIWRRRKSAQPGRFIQWFRRVPRTNMPRPREAVAVHGSHNGHNAQSGHGQHAQSVDGH